MKPWLLMAVLALLLSASAAGGARDAGMAGSHAAALSTYDQLANLAGGPLPMYATVVDAAGYAGGESIDLRALLDAHDTGWGVDGHPGGDGGDAASGLDVRTRGEAHDASRQLDARGAESAARLVAAGNGADMGFAARPHTGGARDCPGIVVSVVGSGPPPELVRTPTRTERICGLGAGDGAHGLVARGAVSGHATADLWAVHADGTRVDGHFFAIDAESAIVDTYIFGGFHLVYVRADTGSVTVV